MITVAAEVEEVLGAAVVERIRAETGEFNCVACGVSGDARTSPTVAVVIATPGQATIRMGHAECTDSQVIHRTDATTRQGPLGEEDITSMVAIVPGAAGPRAMILIDSPALMYFTEAGDAIDPRFTALLDQGWSMYQSLGKTPPAPHGWVLELNVETRTGRVVNSQTGMVLLDRLADPPEEWAAIAAHAGTVVAYYGPLGLEANPIRDYADMKKRLQPLMIAAAGLPVVPVAPETEEVKARRGAIDGLEGILHMRYDSERGRAPGLIDFPVQPVLYPADIGMPAIIVDLNDPDPGRGRRTLAQLQDLGLRPRRAIVTGEPIPLVDWGYLLWRSQILLMRPENREQGKVLFEPITPSRDWWESIDHTAEQAIAILVANLEGQAPSEDLLNHAGAAGELLAGTTTGMKATR